MHFHAQEAQSQVSLLKHNTISKLTTSLGGHSPGDAYLEERLWWRDTFWGFESWRK